MMTFADGRDEDDMRARVVARRRTSSPALERPPYDAAPEWAARWGEQAPPVGTVLRWTPIGSSIERIAVAIGDDEWQTTDQNMRGGTIEFVGLARMIGNSPCSVAVDWREIPTVEARPAGDAAVKDWAAQFLAPQAPAQASTDA